MHELNNRFVFKHQYEQYFGVLVNITTTWHKIQDMSKDN